MAAKSAQLIANNDRVLGPGAIQTGRNVPERLTATILESQGLGSEYCVMDSTDDDPFVLVLKGEYCDIPERDIIQVMRFAYPFKEFEIDVIRRVARAGIPIQYEAGDVIISQAEEGDSMFLIIAGCVYISIDLDESATLPAQQNQFQTLLKGQTFGEHSLVWHEEKSHLWQSYRAREFTASAADYTIIIEFTLEALAPVFHYSKFPKYSNSLLCSGVADLGIEPWRTSTIPNKLLALQARRYPYCLERPPLAPCYLPQSPSPCLPAPRRPAAAFPPFPARLPATPRGVGRVTPSLCGRAACAIQRGYRR
jgi:hypothetical protein